MHVLNTLAPVFLIIALGAALRRFGFLGDNLLAGLNKLAYWVGLPALLFAKIAPAPALDASAGVIAAVVLAATGGMAILAWIAGRVLELPGPSLGSFLQAAFRGNLVYIGLPVILFAFAGNGDAAVAHIETETSVALGPIVVVYNMLAVGVLLASQHKLGLAGAKRIARGMMTNPILLACAAGTAFSLTGLTLPSFALRTLNSVGQCALPVALIAIGGCLVTTRVRGMITPAVVCTVIKVAIGPLLGAAAAVAFGATREQTFVAMILLACPTAVASYVLADQLGGETGLAASVVVLTTLASMISLGAVVALMM